MDENELSEYGYFEGLFRNARENSIIILDAKGIVQEVNNAFTSCFGYTPHEIIGQHGRVLFTEQDRQKGLPEKEIQKVLLEGQAYDNNYLVRKNNSITWVSGESVIVKNNTGEVRILKVVQDIQQQKISEASFERLNNFNESILRSIEDIVVVLNEQLEVITGSPSFYNLFGNASNFNLPVRFDHIIKTFDNSGDLQGKISDTISSKKGFINYAVEIVLPNIENRMYDISCSALEQEGQTNVIVVFHDITSQKQAEREREDIIGFVAHELRNPLANIVLCTEIMGEALQENKLDEVASLLVRTKNNVMRLNKMIAELYDTTRIQSGNLVLEITSFNLKDMIKEAVDTIEILQPAYNIQVKGDADLMIRGDRYRLIQVITNYLSNGIKYSNGKLDVFLNIKHDKKNLTISVKDMGLGITREQLPHIFERFFRAEKTRNLEGIGLGLYLCRQIILHHNGKVWAESELHKGSEFYFSIPL
ncbi:MAG: PAS domain-containing sensor histidine kinase [Ginsengibacter sp.]